MQVYHDIVLMYMQNVLLSSKYRYKTYIKTISETCDLLKKYDVLCAF
jgi:hypothetical protein